MTELSARELAELDAFYAERDASGRPCSFRIVVESLRKVRRAIEAGEVVEVAGGPKLSSVLDFHQWAYARYKLLEEGCDSWIGNDE